MPTKSRRGGGDDAMRMVREDYYDEPTPVPRAVTERRRATVVYPSTVTPKAYGGYGSKTAGSSVGLPSVMPNKRASAARPSYARRGGGDEAMATTLDNSWASAEQRRYRKK